MNDCSDERILQSWTRNARSWISAIENGEIESRLRVTNGAILDAVLKKSRATVLDVGCGEGWLLRALSVEGIDCLGVDAIAEFEAYSGHRGGRFKLVPYEALSYERLQERFDVVVCNFSLLGKESVERIFQHALSLLNTGGSFIVQTIHPRMVSNKDDYIDGWRQGTWAGFHSRFTDPAPWYFRTIESWRALFAGEGFSTLEVVEPVNPDTGEPVSIVFSARSGGE